MKNYRMSIFAFSYIALLWAVVEFVLYLMEARAAFNWNSIITAVALFFYGCIIIGFQLWRTKRRAEKDEKRKYK